MEGGGERSQELAQRFVKDFPKPKKGGRPKLDEGKTPGNSHGKKGFSSLSLCTAGGGKNWLAWS